MIFIVFQTGRKQGILNKIEDPYEINPLNFHNGLMVS